MSIFTFHENYFTWIDDDDDRVAIRKDVLQMIIVNRDKTWLNLHTTYTFRNGMMGPMAKDTLSVSITPDTLDEAIDYLKKYYGEDAFISVTDSDKHETCALVLIRKNQIVSLMEIKNGKHLIVFTKSGRALSCKEKFDDLTELLNQ